MFDQSTKTFPYLSLQWMCLECSAPTGAQLYVAAHQANLFNEEL